MKNANTPYDDVFRTLLNDCPDLIIPVINDVFDTSFVMGQDEVILKNNEWFLTTENGKQEETISDSHIMIRGRYFHIECQSTNDGSMVMRMFEYDIQIAMQHADLVSNQYIIRLPESAVLYLRSTKNTPDMLEIKIEVPGDSCSYQVPVIKVRDYSIDEIFKKKLYFLIPFHIFCYERNLKKYEEDETKLEKLEAIFLSIREQLEDLSVSGKLSEYYKKAITTMAKKVIESLAANYANVAERIGDVMGGKILEYEAKTILNQGRQEGRQEGRREGRQEGRLENQVIVFHNVLNRGMTFEDAVAISEIDPDLAKLELKKRQ